MVAGVKPVLDCIDMEVAPQPDDRPPRLDAIIDRCKATWENFKWFNRYTTVSIRTHAQVVVWSHYLVINLQAIGARFARGTGAMKQEQLKGDVDLFGEVDRDGQG